MEQTEQEKKQEQIALRDKMQIQSNALAFHREAKVIALDNAVKIGTASDKVLSQVEIIQIANQLYFWLTDIKTL